MPKNIRDSTMECGAQRLLSVILNETQKPASIKFLGSSLSRMGESDVLSSLRLCGCVKMPALLNLIQQVS
jgi:hypothetical protein